MDKEKFRTVMTYGLGNNPRQKYNAFTGISIACPFFTTRLYDEEYYKRRLNSRDLTAVCRWVLDRFDKYLLLVGDSLLQFNFMAFCSMSEKEAIERSLAIGNIWYEFCAGISKKFQPRVEVWRWSELAADNEFSRFINAGRNFAMANPAYRSALRALAITSIPIEFEEASKRHNKQELENILDIATNYSIDEIAGLLYIYELTNYKISVSKYEPLPPVKAIYGGHYPELSDGLGLKNFGHIQISKNGKKIHCDDEFLEVYHAIKILGSLEVLI
ncbi:MAG: hypothetical protein Q8N99_07755 [Nanoarchaeota archaeon]|nr:hypothetical protein [Nanoarchaeota archaeon]